MCVCIYISGSPEKQRLNLSLVPSPFYRRRWPRTASRARPSTRGSAVYTCSSERQLYIKWFIKAGP